MCCDKCKRLGGALFLIFGILFLLRDLNVWNFWNIQAWTIIFVLVGCGMICASHCPECKIEAKKKK